MMSDPIANPESRQPPVTDAPMTSTTSETIPQDLSKTDEVLREEAEIEAMMEFAKVAPSGNAIYIVAHANVELVEKLTALGYSLVASEKALYYAKDHSFEEALQWLELHELDKKLDAPVKPKEDSNLTEEEKEKRAILLGKKLRQKISDREKAEAKEREKARIARTRGAHASMDAIQEAERHRQLQQREREKKIDATWKDELRRKQIDDYRERFGEEPPEDYFENQALIRDCKKKMVKDTIMKLQRENVQNQKEALRACFELLITYFKNIEIHPMDLKYKKIKTSNRHFVEKVQPFDDAIELMRLIGFTDLDEDGSHYLIMEDLPSHTLGDAIKYLVMLHGLM